MTHAYFISCAQGDSMGLRKRWETVRKTARSCAKNLSVTIGNRPIIGRLVKPIIGQPIYRQNRYRRIPNNNKIQPNPVYASPQNT